MIDRKESIIEKIIKEEQESSMIDVENIKLEYKVIIKVGEDAFWSNGCEVFMDEHEYQWVKFVARNGYHAGKEHMIRTDRVTIIRDEEKA